MKLKLQAFFFPVLHINLGTHILESITHSDNSEMPLISLQATILQGMS